jgi:D-tagatose-1,6-bisphosphate aldolase subunit GatZ/KbaZ
MSDPLRSLKRGTSLTSVCSAHPLVLEAALRHAAAHTRPVLIEATCNQVNQEGGYTGLTPADFRRQVDALAVETGLQPGLLLLGGDHLGPNPWTSLPAEAALQRAEAMVAAYVAAGFSKLHLDTSMACADDPIALAEPVIAARAARLARIAETVAREHALPPPVYVLGTEVPPPGGAREHIEALTPTDPAAAERTLALHAEAFAEAGLAEAMQRVIALVVQPGVEFGTENVVVYQPTAARGLAAVLDRHPGLMFEAHSTDYQPREALAALARDGFALLKVGPGLTFALREALYRLDDMAQVLAPSSDPPLPAVMEQVMLETPAYWHGHYHGDHLRLLRHYSYSDRIRYYWPNPLAAAAVSRLLARLDAIELPQTLLSQYFPMFRDRIRHGTLASTPRNLLMEAVIDVLRDYDQE